MTYPLSKRLDRERKLLGEKQFSELWQVDLQKTAVKYRLDTFSDVAPVLKEKKYNHTYHICFNAPFSQWMSVSVFMLFMDAMSRVNIYSSSDCHLTI